TTRDEPIGPTLWTRRFQQALELRDTVRPPDTDAYRLVHGEGDRLPGAVVDAYGTTAVLRLDGLGATALEEDLVRALYPLLEARGFDRLLVRKGRRGDITVTPRVGALPDAPIVVREHGMRLVVDLVHGQKTGLFLDHRESRRRVRELSRGKRVLNLYSYTGGFSVAAGLGEALEVTSVDVAEGAITMAEATWAANGLDPRAHRAVASDVPVFLSEKGRGAPVFDLIVSDPPSFAPNEKSVPKAIESYRALHRACLKRLVPGGLYLAASCSSHIDRDTFERTIREGAELAGRVLQVLERWGAPADHPRLLAFPEGDYLKSVLCRPIG
ncbi:MAG: class I SAM-dependent rRNA methyltransferase, partial [Polyangiaceae bacterium]|nr:class I SAM-dependent rRNA methyltransferase [Polyangiaceae bacterium]